MGNRILEFSSLDPRDHHEAPAYRERRRGLVTRRLRTEEPDPDKREQARRRRKYRPGQQAAHDVLGARIRPSLPRGGHKRPMPREGRIKRTRACSRRGPTACPRCRQSVGALARSANRTYSHRPATFATTRTLCDRVTVSHPRARACEPRAATSFAGHMGGDASSEAGRVLEKHPQFSLGTNS